MKKIFLITLLLISTVLTACQQQSAVCGDGLVLVEGVCVVETEDIVETGSCDTTISDYGVNYDMVWNDEFDTDGRLDETKWEYQIGNGGSYGIPGWGNSEAQYYTDDLENVEVKDGYLRIIASTENYAQYEYTSGRVRTANLADFQYGVIEVCAKLPDTLGTWPAIWMLPTDSPYGAWPSGGEIDIMEAVGFESNTIHFNIHTQNNNWGTSQSVGSHSNISNIASEYHSYAIKWLEDEIVFYVDGVEHFSYSPNSMNYQDWPFDTEFHLLLNIAIGGSWGGARGIEDGEWTDTMYVDFVRIYQEN